ncbi:hypothetical protein POVCU2_0096560 [Plasmodium ovale curtisi]|uniref:Uncharacterized protein n=1 Tax=Plasmodium ovale curtisi TaxID=864141 RepID=A0A1A8VLZ8_PLAOA|nr:hypothetical protein POVCU1_002230 [Plasmodium ovale curtisi]SBS95533.1 hypothetical protein POVCU2_0096560 [Plasmodium ovale curtisi]
MLNEESNHSSSEKYYMVTTYWKRMYHVGEKIIPVCVTHVQDYSNPCLFLLLVSIRKNPCTNQHSRNVRTNVRLNTEHF